MMSQRLHVYSKEELKNEPFLPLARPFARSLDMMEKLKKQVRKYRGNGIWKTISPSVIKNT